MNFRKLSNESLYQLSFEKKVSSNSCWIILSADARRLLYCQGSAAMFTRTLRFGSYRTKVLGPQQPSLEKIAASMIYSTHLTADGSRLFFYRQYVVPGHEVPVAIERESPTTFVRKKCNFVASFQNSESRGNEIVTLLIVSSNVLTWTLNFVIYRTIDLGHQNPSFEKIAGLVFHSTNLKTDESRPFFLVVVRKIFLGTWGSGSNRTRVSNNFR